MISIASISLLFLAINARVIDHPCEHVEVQENFDLDRYTGLWYEIEHDCKFFWEKSGECITAHYSQNEDGTITVWNSQTEEGSNERSGFEGVAYVEEGADLQVIFFGIYEGDYKVLATDYDNYSIVYSCNEFSFLEGKSKLDIWLMSRTPTVSQE